MLKSGSISTYSRQVRSSSDLVRIDAYFFNFLLRIDDYITREIISQSDDLSTIRIDDLNMNNEKFMSHIRRWSCHSEPRRIM